MRRSLIATIKGKKDGAKFDPQTFSKRLSKAHIFKSSDEKKKSSFSPSSVVYGNGKCARYWHYAFAGATFNVTNDAASVAAMENGIATHDRLQKRMLNAGLVKEIERNIRNEDPPINAYVDLVVEEDGEEIFGEIKSVKDAAFEEALNGHDPKSYHMIQLLIYMYVSNVNEGFILYENKNTHEFAVFPVIMNDRTRAMVEPVIEWMRSTKATIDEGSVPKRGFSETSYACKGCPVKKQCWSDPEGTVKVANLEI
jgi:CRISPR/Cas system-associated exonuclease Cas4 (RecB family)